MTSARISSVPVIDVSCMLKICAYDFEYQESKLTLQLFLNFA